MYRIEVSGFERMINELRTEGYIVVGPQVRDGAILIDEIASAEDLPRGWTDEQKQGGYGLARREDGAFFGYVVGPHSFKKYLFPPKTKLFSLRKEGTVPVIVPSDELNGTSSPRYAFLGARPCELHALTVQDNVFLKGPFADDTYSCRSEQVFIVAVNCLVPGGNCFCLSMDSGPTAETGFDLCLTEIVIDNEQCFLVQTGSGQGEDLLNKLPHRNALPHELEAMQRGIEEAEGSFTKRMDTDSLKGLLLSSHDHAEWEEVGARCLTCGNCTLVCPTCFCSTVTETTDLSGGSAERWRVWDSCFSLSFARVAGGNFRPSAAARYRQWLTHKLGFWNDQFGTSGCVGCGRCITWCPVGIDITEEVQKIRHRNSVAEGV